MITVKKFTFSPFSENTYVLYDETKECVIIDPGCSNPQEEKELTGFIEKNELKPVKLLNTHCHIDHIFGNKFVSEKYSIHLEANENDAYNIIAADEYSMNFGVPAPGSPHPKIYLNEGDVVKFGNSHLRVIFVPGHSAGHIAFVADDEEFVVSGDVLFYGSIGRTDLPGGSYSTLMKSIVDKMLKLPDNFKVYCGHGPETTIGAERKQNPFILEYLEEIKNR
jgi:hydroxyacylglutathione hydrolase